MFKAAKKIKVLLFLSLLVLSLGVSGNIVLADGMQAFDISHQATHQFSCYGDTYNAQMNIQGHIIISADRKTIDVYYDVNTEHTNIFGCLLKAYNNNDSLMSQKAYVMEYYFRPTYNGWEVNEDFTENPSGHVQYTFNEPVGKIKLGYYMSLMPVAGEEITICNNTFYKEIILD